MCINQWQRGEDDYIKNWECQEDTTFGRWRWIKVIVNKSLRGLAFFSLEKKSVC